LGRGTGAFRSALLYHSHSQCYDRDSRMPVPSAMLTPRAVLLSLVVGSATGALVALIADRISQRGKPALLIDTILGAIGFVGGAIGLGFLPAIQHSTTTRAGGLIIHTTTRNYSEAYQLAFGVASLMPILYEVLRYRRARRDGQTGVEKRKKWHPSGTVR